MEVLSPPPSRMMVSSFVMVIFLARPIMLMSVLSSFKPKSSLMTCASCPPDGMKHLDCQVICNFSGNILHDVNGIR